MPKLYDVAVVGAGTMGSMAALALAKTGLSVVLLDPWHPPHDHGSHHGDSRLYRQAYAEGLSYVPLALEARERWLELERRSRVSLFHPWGVLNVQPEFSPEFAAKRSAAEAWGLRVEVLSAETLGKRWPGIHPGSQDVGLFEVDGGVLEAGASVKVALHGAQAFGAELVTGARVTRLEGEHPVRLESTAGTWYANRVLVTAGTSTPGLIPALDRRIRTVRKVVGWFDADGYDAPGFPPFTYLDEGGQYYGFPSVAGGGLKVGRHDGGREFPPHEEPLAFGVFPEDEGDLRAFLQRRLPGSAGPLVRWATCRYDVSDDENFVLGQVPDRPIWYATGFSGHGFKFAPALGNHLARWIANDELSPELAQLSRFVPDTSKSSGRRRLEVPSLVAG